MKNILFVGRGPQKALFLFHFRGFMSLETNFPLKNTYFGLQLSKFWSVLIYGMHGHVDQVCFAFYAFRYFPPGLMTAATLPVPKAVQLSRFHCYEKCGNRALAEASNATNTQVYGGSRQYAYA